MQRIQKVFDDLDLMCETLRAWDVQFYLLDGILQGQTAGAFVQNFGEHAVYGYAGFAPPLSMSGAPPEGMITFNMMEPSVQRYWMRGHDLDSGMAWVFPQGAELRSASPPGFKVHTLSVPDQLIEQIAVSLELTLPPPSKCPEVFLLPSASQAFVMHHLCEFRDYSAAFSPGNVRAVLRVLLECWIGPTQARSPRRPNMRSRDRALGKCMELIFEGQVAQLTTSLLLERSGVSERTLQYAFRDRFGVPPSTFCRSLNLSRVRTALRAGDIERDAVRDIAARFGFSHMGQFARDYRGLFGERPSDTLRNRGRVS